MQRCRVVARLKPIYFISVLIDFSTGAEEKPHRPPPRLPIDLIRRRVFALYSGIPRKGYYFS